MYKIVSLVAVSLLAAGCVTVTPDSSPTASPPEVTSQAPTQAPVDNTDAIFIATLEREFGPMDSATAATSKSVASKICTLLEMDTPLDTIANISKSAGFNDYQAGYLIGASVKAYCPEFLDTIS